MASCLGLWFPRVVPFLRYPSARKEKTKMAKEVRITLTDVQKAKIKAATGKTMSEIRVSSVGKNLAASPSQKTLTAQDLTAQDLTAQDLTSQDLTSQDLTSQDLTAQDLTAQDLTAQDLTAQDLTAQDLTAQDLTAQDLTA